MRRNNFLIGALIALATFITLSAFIGRRPWGRHYGYGWRYDRCYYEGRGRNGDDMDKTGRGVQPRTDSAHIH